MMMSQQEPPSELPDQETDLVYSFCAAPDVVPSKAGIVFSAQNSGLYKSEDGGRTWQYALQKLELVEPLPVTAVAMSPVFQHDNLVLAGAPGGLFHSTDAGQNWKALVFPNPPPTISSLVFSPNFENDETVFAGSMEDGVFISRDGGERWAAWNFGLLDLNIMALAISPSFAEDETIFAAVETGIFRSTNGGRAWREIELPFGYEPVLSLAISPNFAADGTLLAGTETDGLWITRDAGGSWEQIGKDVIDSPVNFLQTFGNKIFVFSSSAIWYSADSGKSWVKQFPPEDQDMEISAALAIYSTQLPSLVIGQMDGEIHIVHL